MKKSGLLYEGTLLEAGKNNTGICDVDIYGITKKIYCRKIRLLKESYLSFGANAKELYFL